MASNLHSSRRPEQAKATPAQPAWRFIKLAEVRRLTTLSTSEIYRRMAAGTFPARVLLGPKSAVWIEAEVLAWCEDRIAQREAA